MQSSAAVRSLFRFLSPSLPRLLTSQRPHSSFCIAAGAGDPAIHSERQAEEAAKAAASEMKRKILPPITVKTLPFTSSPRLEYYELPQPPNPTYQHKRRHSTADPPTPPLDDVSCVGWDGTPLAGGEAPDWGEEPEENNKEYFENRKPSPLSEVAFADTRKPVEKAWDHATSGYDMEGGDSAGGFVKDSVDAALQRGELLFQAAKERWDPETPWGRVLLKSDRIVGEELDMQFY